MTVKIKCTEIINYPIDELQSHPDNADVHPRDQRLVEDLAHIFKSPQGFNLPLKINTNIAINKELGLPEDKYIISCGHARVEALTLAGEKKAPCIPIYYDNADMLFADLIADNATNERREISKSELNLKLEKLDGINFDMKLLGFEDFVVDMAEFDLSNKDKKEEGKKEKQCPSCGFLF